MNLDNFQPVPPRAEPMTVKQGAKLIEVTQRSAAAALAGGMIAASGRPHSVEEAKAVFVEAYNTLFPAEEG